MRVPRRFLVFVVVPLVILTAFALPPAPLLAGSAAEAAEAISVARSENEFALSLYEQLAGESEGSNLFFSPASISTALAMAYGGARGTTAEEMKKTLRFELDDAQLHPAMGALAQSLTTRREGCELSLANALWGQKGHPFRETFLELNRDYYGARLAELDFRDEPEASRLTINRWVERKTNDRIRDLLAPGTVTESTRLVLTNAIYFKGSWKTEFNPEQTTDEPFHVSPNTTVDVPLMHLREASFPYFQGDGLQALELPYSGDRIAMLILLPEETSSVKMLESSLTGAKLDEWIRQLATRKIDDIALPRFKTTEEYELATPLKRMGMVTAFTPAADFSGMAEGERLSISEVVHKAFVEVNEAGTEAAAATAVGIRTTSYTPPVRFRGDRPFLYLIRDRESGTILFLGKLVDPT